jgi:hypothetical protein
MEVQYNGVFELKDEVKSFSSTASDASETN